MNRRPTFDDLVDDETTGADRERLRGVHDLLLRAGPPPELPPELEAGPNLQMTIARKRKRQKGRAMMLLAAALVGVLVFIGGYAIGNGSGGGTSSRLVTTLNLKGTAAAPDAKASLEVWHPKDGNWPMTLSVIGLDTLPARRYYEVYIVRGGKILGSCGVFRVQQTRNPVVVTLNAPYPYQKGDTWVVNRQGSGGAEPGTTVLKPVTA
jgi:hypothetical protein